MTNKATDHSILKKALSSLTSNKGLVICRTPGSNKLQLVVGEVRQIEEISHFDFEKEACFMMSAFDTQKTPSFCIVNPVLEIIDSNELKDHYFEEVKSFLPDIQVDVSTRTYENLVTKGVAHIIEGKFRKVVLSRCQNKSYPKDFNPFKILQALLESYKSAFVYMIIIPETLCYIGATPELLAKIDSKQVFKTVSLAGTRVQQTSGSATWQPKEIEEQALVTEYIVDYFKQAGVENYYNSGPSTLKAGQLLHLKTEFIFDKKDNALADINGLLQQLHPTPAICGLPKNEALNFIRQEEKYDRAYYTGVLGFVNFPDSTELYVNLRCMQLTKKNYTLYAGAGITADSKPKLEFEETVHKMNTLARFIS